ncbi:MAG: hypothetical protein ABIE74_01635 [Pseudomonadota bacterium]
MLTQIEIHTLEHLVHEKNESETSGVEMSSKRKKHLKKLLKKATPEQLENIYSDTADWACSSSE